MKLSSRSKIILLLATGFLAVSWLRPRAHDGEHVATAGGNGWAGSGRAPAAPRSTMDEASGPRAFEAARGKLLRGLRALSREPVVDTQSVDSDDAPPPVSAATPYTPAVGDMPPDPANTLPPEEMLSYALSGMRDVFPMIRDCYASKTSKTSGAADSVSLRFVVEGDAQSGGVVTNSEVQGLDAQQKDLATCVSDSVYAAKFDPPARGGAVTVEMSFNPSHPPEEDLRGP